MLPTWNYCKISVLSFERYFHGVCHMGFKSVINKEAFSPSQATEPPTPCFLDPNLHLLGIHPYFLLGRNNDSVLVVDLRNIFSLEDDHRLYSLTIPTACQYHCNSILLVSCGADFDGFLTHVVDHTVWCYVKSERSFIHISNETERVTMFFTKTVISKYPYP